MAIYTATFRIHEDATYADRYNSVVEAIKKVCHGGQYWDEPTSFFLFENPSTAKKITEYIDANSAFAPSKDLLLVINLSLNDYSVIGKVNDNAIYALMKKR